MQGGSWLYFSTAETTLVVHLQDLLLKHDVQLQLLGALVRQILAGSVLASKFSETTLVLVVHLQDLLLKHDVPLQLLGA